MKLYIPPLTNPDDADRCLTACHTLALAGGAVWSIPETIDCMDQVAYNQLDVQLVYDIHWGKHAAKISVGDNPTWRTLAESAAKAIEDSGDNHHVFIEAFNIGVDRKMLELLTGS